MCMKILATVCSAAGHKNNTVAKIQDNFTVSPRFLEPSCSEFSYQCWLSLNVKPAELYAAAYPGF
jgi:hypothetical protein